MDRGLQPIPGPFASYWRNAVHRLVHILTFRRELWPRSRVPTAVIQLR
ncbi:hypothetical protein ppKF707_1842 [Metapseudomonas furukawaii]|uniref:Uncharacterized protein n=1 Tax=Metapseudomonas furukawaii TaxID=1149133 RepID=A0AAD1C591_METFU|nr:hypothetical protein ppKF707_1842 [Pseudomonas furukawaii]BAU76836.1 hypothetical protein KF707C_51480 [Pseudomonas furukawaii]